MGDELERDWFWSDDAINYIEEFETTFYKLARKQAIQLVIHKNKEVITKEDVQSFVKIVLNDMNKIV